MFSSYRINWPSFSIIISISFQIEKTLISSRSDNQPTKSSNNLTSPLIFHFSFSFLLFFLFFLPALFYGKWPHFIIGASYESWWPSWFADHIAKILLKFSSFVFVTSLLKNSSTSAHFSDEMVQIWQMEAYPCGDPRLPHHLFPPKMITPDELSKRTGTLYYKVPIVSTHPSFG